MNDINNDNDRDAYSDWGSYLDNYTHSDSYLHNYRDRSTDGYTDNYIYTLRHAAAERSQTRHQETPTGERT